MKAFVTILAACALSPCLAMGADPVFDSFAKEASSGSVTAAYDYSVQGTYSVSGSGAIVVSGSCFRMVGGGVEVWCDGEYRWTLDRDAKEAYREDASGGLGADLPLLLSDPGRFLDVVSSGTSSLGGRRYHVVRLSTKFESDITSAEFHFEGKRLRVVDVSSKDGTKTEVRLSSIDFAPSLPKGDFSVDVKSLGAGWVVTEL